MQDHPWRARPKQWQDECKYQSLCVEKLRTIKVPIHTLVHITHNAEARNICREFMFQAKKKFGKTQEFDGRALGETFRFDGQGKKFVDIQPRDPVYTHIPVKEPVFPGYYSWWGIDCSAISHSEQFTSPRMIATMLEDLKDEQAIAAYVPGYLNEVPESLYGNRAFSCNFHDLLRSYAESRRNEIGNICIRKGGTLRYKKEICYVLIICIDCDKDREELSEYGVLQQQRQFQGKFSNLLDYETTPTFNPEYIIRWAKGYKDYSYETAAFAFYFPSHRGVLAIERRFCSEKEIKHDKVRCIKKKPSRWDREWKCPNDL